MRKTVNVILFGLALMACNKEDKEIEKKVTVPYALPWKTEYIHYENVSMCSGSHSS